MVYNKTDWASHDVITTGKMNNIEDGIQTALNNSIFGHGGAEQPSEGTHVTTYIDLGDNFPKNALSGDVTYVRDGDDYKIYQYDGVSWVEQINPKFSQRLEKTMLEAKAQTETLISDNQVNVDKTINEVKEEQKNLQEGLNNLDTNAQDYANKALADARADIATTAVQTAKDASDALAKAKTDLTTSLNKEVTDRANAVTALDTKAKGYADTAKADAISASTTALNTAKTDLTTSLNKEVTDRTKAVSDLDTKAQGYANTARTDAIATANGAVAKEVTDRQKAVTDLDTKATNAVNQAKSDITDTIKALSVGGRNIAFGTTDFSGGNWTDLSNLTKSDFQGLTSSSSSAVWSGPRYKNSSIESSGFVTSTSDLFVASVWLNNTGTSSVIIRFYGDNVSPENYQITVLPANSGWVRVQTTPFKYTKTTGLTGTLIFSNTTAIQGGALKQAGFKIEKGNKSTDWTPAPEDIVLDYTTKDNVISQSLTQYQATNDGKVTKAQSDATQALGLVATKVSQTDYNAKTGDLDSKYTTVKQTADQASTDIVAIKSDNKSQDTKINTLTSDVNGTKQSISDIQTEQGKQSTKINTIQTDVSGTKQEISDIKDANGVQDGKIVSISTTVDGLSSSFSTYKTTNDGKVSKAQSDIAANATAISQKVSQTAYDTKTGQLQTDLNTTTTTANQAKTDIVAIKKTNTDQDTRMTTIESDANGIKTTVRSLQTTANTQAGSISTLQQRADGFDATVTKVNNLSVGGRNLLLHTNTNAYSGLNPGNGVYTTQYVPFDGGYKYQFTYTTPSTNWAVYMFWGLKKDKFEPDTDYVLSFMANFTSDVTPSVAFSAPSTQHNFVRQITKPKVTGGSDQRVVIQLHTDPTILTESDQGLYMGNFQYAGSGTFTIWDLKIEKGNLASSYTPAPEDVDSTIAKAQLTADNASLALSNYKTDADGRISKAQSDITANASAITQKVAQTVYDAKVGDLTTKVSTAQQTADSVTTSLNSYKSSNDSKVTKAQADIVVNTNAIATKVSQTVYDAKTGQLQADLNTTTATANTSKQDIVAIKSDNTKQDARMTTIESDANGTKTTVSNLQTDLGKANGSITTLQQRADGFDATVTKVNNLSVGGTNLVSGTNQEYQMGYGIPETTWQDGYAYLKLPTNIINGEILPQSPHTFFYTLSQGTTYTQTIWFETDATVKDLSVAQITWYTKAGHDVQPAIIQKLGQNSYKIVSTYTWPGKTDNNVRLFDIERLDSAFNLNTGTYLKFGKLKLEKGNLATDWSPAPEDVDGATAKAQLTADNASLALSNYKTDADGRISKAQADIVVNANAITQKVSQSDYNAKTGDLTTKVNTAQSTADSATSTIGAYKTSNDARVASAESKITANATAITQKVSQTDYNTKTGQIDGQISTINQTAGQISQSVADVNGRIDNISVGGTNLLLGSQDFTGTGTERWVINGTIVANAYQGLSAVQSWGAWSGPKYQESNLVSRWGALDTTNTFTLSEWIRNTSTTKVEIKFYGDNVQGSGLTVATLPANSDWVRVSAQFKFLVATPSSGARIRFEPITGVTGGYVQHAGMKLESGTLASSYSPAPEDTDNKISTVSQTVDSISSIVSDPTTGLTKRIQTAEGTLSQVTGADIPNLQKATFWQPYSSLDFNSYTKQGSFFFNTTAVKPNAPTTKTNYMYLVVEQGTSDSQRVVQTAWYDTQTDAKITYRRQYAGTWSPWYANDNDSVTTISQTNGAIRQEVKDRADGDSNTLTQSKDFTTSSISNSESGMRSQITQTSDAIIAQVNSINMVANSEFDPVGKGWYQVTPAAGSSLGSELSPGSLTGSFGDWPEAGGSQMLRYDSGNWYASAPKQATSGRQYSASIVAGRVALTSSVALDLRILWLDASRKVIGYSSAGNIINTATYTGLKLYKLENQTSPANTAFVAIAIAHSGATSGGYDVVGRPMLNIGSKVGTYSPTYSSTASTTQLALMKDNWSIGINDNTGKLASGVFGTIDGMNLVGNKMTINANQTTITGTTWIQTGMIGQGIIGSAQISQLDVNKLVGNTSNFVKSAWDSAYGSTVTIDGSGMAIRAGGNNGFYTRLQSGKLQFESLYSDATKPGGVRHEIIGSVFGGSDAQVGGDVDALSFTLFDQTFPSFTDGHPVGSPKDGSGYIWGGDKITWNVADTQAGHVRELFGWYNATASNVQGISRGFNFFDRVNFNGSEIEISGAQNNLIFTWAQFNGYFSNEKNPAIVAANKGWRGGGIAFGNNNVVVYNAANGVNKILM